MFLLVPAYAGSPGKMAVKRLCVCVNVVGACGTAATRPSTDSSEHSVAHAANFLQEYTLACAYHN